MKIPRFARARFHTAYAFGAVLICAVALTQLAPLVPDGALGVLRSLIPAESSLLQLLLLGWIGVGLGRLTLAAPKAPAERGGQAATPRDADGKEEKVDSILRHIAKVLQGHMTDSDSFSKRLDGANQRLSQQEAAGPIKEIVMALIEDNREMRDRLVHRQEPARRVAPPGGPLADKPRTGGRSELTRRRDRDWQPALLRRLFPGGGG